MDDDIPIPQQALFRWSRLIQIAAAAILLWMAPMAVLIAVCGWEHTLTQMGWFFTKAA